VKAGATKAMWLYLLRAKRRLGAPEIAKHANLEDSAVRAMLKSMVQAGSVARHEPNADHGVLYEVTPTCAVPLGVSVQEIWKSA
jgi:DNA-binding MarR family transcriptional regulator